MMYLFYSFGVLIFTFEILKLLNAKAYAEKTHEAIRKINNSQVLDEERIGMWIDVVCHLWFVTGLFSSQYPLFAMLILLKIGTALAMRSHRPPVAWICIDCFLSSACIVILLLNKFVYHVKIF